MDLMLAAILLVASGAVLAEYIIHSSSPMSIVVPDDYPTIQKAIQNAHPAAPSTYAMASTTNS